MSGVKRGDPFLHSHWIRETPGTPVRQWPPEECIVAHVSDTSVYYRTLPDGDLWRLPLETFEGIAVREWLGR